MYSQARHTRATRHAKSMYVLSYYALSYRTRSAYALSYHALSYRTRSMYAPGRFDSPWPFRLYELKYIGLVSLLPRHELFRQQFEKITTDANFSVPIIYIYILASVDTTVRLSLHRSHVTSHWVRRQRERLQRNKNKFKPQLRHFLILF